MQYLLHTGEYSMKQPLRPSRRGPVQGGTPLGAAATRLDAHGGCGCGHGIAKPRHGRLLGRRMVIVGACYGHEHGLPLMVMGGLPAS